MNPFGVTDEKANALYLRMSACGVTENELEEQFVRSGGPGGQHVNRSATCVRLKHARSGIEVKMQQARSQGLNRYYARKRLCELLEARDQGADSPEALRAARARKQKARRARRSRQKTDSGRNAE